MSKEAMKLAVRSLKELVPDDSDHAPAIQGQRKRQENAIKALQEALAEQPAQQEYERGFIDGMQEQMKRSVDRAVNAMAQRTWVGLTDEEANKIYKDGSTFGEMMRMVEAKLKEKNT